MLEQLACRAMQWRGLADSPIHPKHLFDESRGAFCRQHFHPGMSFLDLGSGVGTECIAAAKAGAIRVVGIEKDRLNHQHAVKRAEKAGVAVDFILHDLEETPLPVDSAAFDLVNMSNVLEHLTRRAAVLSELRRVKRGDGVAVISVPNRDTTWKRALRSVGLDSRDDKDHKIEYTKELLAAELRDAELEITSPLTNYTEFSVEWAHCAECCIIAESLQTPPVLQVYVCCATPSRLYWVDLFSKMRKGRRVVLITSNNVDLIVAVQQEADR